MVEGSPDKRDVVSSILAAGTTYLLLKGYDMNFSYEGKDYAEMPYGIKDSTSDRTRQASIEVDDVTITVTTHKGLVELALEHPEHVQVVQFNNIFELQELLSPIIAKHQSKSNSEALAV